MRFTEIKTQEEFDNAIKDRLERQEKTIRAEYTDYDSLKAKNEELTKQLSTLNDDINNANTKFSDLETKYNDSISKIAKYESDSVKTKLAINAGLPLEMVDRIKGTNEDEIKADIETLVGLVKQPTQTVNTQPMFQPEGDTNSEDGALRELINSLNN